MRVCVGITVYTRPNKVETAVQCFRMSYVGVPRIFWSICEIIPLLQKRKKKLKIERRYTIINNIERLLHQVSFLVIIVLNKKLFF